MYNNVKISLNEQEFYVLENEEHSGGIGNMKLLGFFLFVLVVRNGKDEKLEIEQNQKLERKLLSYASKPIWSPNRWH